MKTLLKCAASAIIILTITTCLMGQEMRNPKFFTDKNRYISFIAPQDWELRQVNEDDPRTKLVFTHTDLGTQLKVSLTILAYQVETPRTLESLKSFLTHRLNTLRKHGAVFSDIEEVSVADTTCVQTQIKADGNTSLVILGYPDNSLCLDIVYHAPDSLFDSYLSTVRDSIDSLVTLKGAILDDPELREQQRLFWLKKQVFFNMDNGDYDTAREMLKELIIAEPENFSLYFQVGMTYMQQKYYTAATEYFDKATQLFPDYWEAYFQNGVAYMHKENYEKAVEQFEKTIAINKQSVEATVNLAIAYRKLGEPEKAVELYKKLLELNPTNQVYLFNLGRTYSDIGNFEQAKTCFEKCIEIDPENASAMVNLAYVYMSVSNFDKARELCEQALLRDSELEQAKTLLNELKQVEGQ